jgi:hypothetical protein
VMMLTLFFRRCAAPARLLMTSPNTFVLACLTN